MTQSPSRAFRRWCAASIVLVASWSLPGSVYARVSPMEAVKYQMRKPNFLIVVESGASMQGLPGENSARFNEVGADCQDGDRFCRLNGQTGRCEFSGMGGYGYRFDYVPAGTNTASGTRTSTGGSMTVTQSATGTRNFNPTVAKTASSSVPSGATGTVSITANTTVVGTQSGNATATISGSQTYYPTVTMTSSRTDNTTSTVTKTWSDNTTSTVTRTWSDNTTSTVTRTFSENSTVTGNTVSTQTLAAIGVAANVVGYWPLDEDGTQSPHTYYDSSGNNYDAVATGNPARLASLFSYAATFAPNTKYATVPSMATLDLNAGASISAWVNLSDFNTKQVMVGFTPGATSEKGGGLRLFLNQNYVFFDNNTPVVSNTSPTIGVSLATNSWASGGWVFLVGTVSSSKNWSLYEFNGCSNSSTKVATSTGIGTATDTGLKTVHLDAGAVWCLGGECDGATGSTHINGLNGSLDEVRIWSKALSATEAASLCTYNYPTHPAPTGTMTMTQTGTPTKTASSTYTDSATRTTTNTGTVTPTVSKTWTTTNTGTVTPTVSRTWTTTNTGTVTPTVSKTWTTTNTGTVTPTVSNTWTTTNTGTVTPTFSRSSTTTYVGTLTSSASRTGTTTNTGTLSSTASSTAAFSATGTVTQSATTPSIGTVTDVGSQTLTMNGTQTLTGTATTTLVVKPLPDTANCTPNSCLEVQRARCYLDSGRDCSSDDDCSTISGDVCQNFKPTDPGRVLGDTCVLDAPTGRTCRYEAKNCSVSLCGTGDYCVDGTPAQMCQKTGLWCGNSNWCDSSIGDACVPATSRVMMVKNAVRRVMLEHAYDDKAVVKMGHMHTFQADRTGNTANLFPYVKLDTSLSVTTRTEVKFLPRSELLKGDGGGGAPCFSEAQGPTASCTIDYSGGGAVDAPPVIYTRRTGSGNPNSRYAVPTGDGKNHTRVDADWNGMVWSTGNGMGLYEGSYYTFDYRWGTPVSSGLGSVAQPKYGITYKGKSYLSGVDVWFLMDAERSEFVNENKYGANEFTGDKWSPGFTPAGPEYSLPLVGANTSDFKMAGTCNETNGAQWDSSVVPMVNDTTFPGPPAVGKTLTPAQKALMNAARLEKSSYGGFYATGNTEPVACALKNDTKNDKYHSVDGYMSIVRSNDSAANGGTPCWENHVLLVVDGLPSGPGDVALNGIDCSAPACVYDPNTNASLAGCNCPAVQKARALADPAVNVNVHVIAASRDPISSNPYAAATLNNIARAGSTNPNFINIPRYATNEDELYYWINYEMKQALRVTVATTPASAASGSQSMLGITVGNKLFQTTVELPEWRGNLVAFDITGSTGTKTVVTTNTAGQTATATATTINYAATSVKDAATVNKFTVWGDTELGDSDQNMWKQRRVFFSDGGGDVYAVLKDDGTINTDNLSRLQGLGMGTNAAETTQILEWMLGKPDPSDPKHRLLNPAVMGSVINSMAIDVGPPGASTMPGGNHFWFTYALRKEVVYLGADDGMLHAFNADTLAEAFAFIPADMIKVIAKLYAQGGQRYNPGEHLYGLSGSPKVKTLCVRNCKVKPGLTCSDDPGGTYQAGCPEWATILVMTEGQGGNHPFALDITDPVPANGKPTLASKDLLWHVGYKGASGVNQGDLGETDSVPAFAYHRTSDPDPNDYRVLMASSGYGFPPGTSSTPKLINAKAWSGDVIGPGVMSISQPSPSCTVQSFAVVGDVSVARDNFHTADGVNADQSLLATFVPDTWGTLHEYYGADQSNPTTPIALGCGHPLHFSPTVVQLNRNDANNADNSIYLAQVTNSILDPDTVTYSSAFPASMLVVAKMTSNSIKAPVPALDPTFGDNGLIKLSAEAPEANRLCGVTTGKTGNATTCGPDGSWLPKTARPTGSPVAVLRGDGGGFQIYTTWYSPPAPSWDNCQGSSTNGDSYVTVHEFLANGTWAQIYGMQILHQYVTGVQFLGTSLFITSGDGTVPETPNGIGNFGQTFTSVDKSMKNLIGDRFIRTAWTERIDAE